jgi:hypothetical protein
MLEFATTTKYNSPCILSSPDISPIERTPAVIKHTHIRAFVCTRTLRAPVTYDYQNYSTNLKIFSIFATLSCTEWPAKGVADFRCYYTSHF